MFWILERNLENRKGKTLRMANTITNKGQNIKEWQILLPQKLASTSQHLFSMDQCPSNEHCCQRQTEVPDTIRKQNVREWQLKQRQKNDKLI
jgi:hypothetical protein